MNNEEQERYDAYMGVAEDTMKVVLTSHCNGREAFMQKGSLALHLAREIRESASERDERESVSDPVEGALGRLVGFEKRHPSHSRVCPSHDLGAGFISVEYEFEHEGDWFVLSAVGSTEDEAAYGVVQQLRRIGMWEDEDE